jgi:hypothetical protein
MPPNLDEVLGLGSPSSFFRGSGISLVGHRQARITRARLELNHLSPDRLAGLPELGTSSAWDGSS